MKTKEKALFWLNGGAECICGLGDPPPPALPRSANEPFRAPPSQRQVLDRVLGLLDHTMMLADLSDRPEAQALFDRFAMDVVYILSDFLRQSAARRD